MKNRKRLTLHSSRLPPRALCRLLACWPGWIALATLAWAACGGIVKAQNPPASRRLQAGTHLFRHILHEMEFQPLLSFAQLGDDPTHKLLIVLGETDVLDRVPGGLDRFIKAGGSALIATDRFDDGHGLGDFGVRFFESPLQIDSESPFAYRKSRECIVVEATQAGRPLFQSLKKVATNRPGYINGRRSRLPVLGRFPREVELENPRARPPLTFALGGQTGDGRILFLSDHSVFINAMLLPEDNDNYDFARNCVLWLTQNDRTQALFVEEGTIQTRFNVPVREQPLPPVESIVQAVDQGLQGLEEENRFNEILSDALNRLPIDTLLKLIFIGTTLGLAVYGLALLAHSRHQIRDETPLLATAVEQLMSRLDLAEQRQRWLLRSGNYWETARSLARQELETWFGSKLSVDQVEKLEVKGGWWRRLVTRRRLRALWRLAYGDRPRTITGRDLVRMGAVIDELRKDLPGRGA